MIGTRWGDAQIKVTFRQVAGGFLKLLDTATKLIFYGHDGTGAYAIAERVADVSTDWPYG